MIDGFGRTIDYARISVTDLCNLRCEYCMPPDGVQKKLHSEILSIEELYGVAKALVSLGVKKIRLTGGEPLVRRGFVSLCEMISSLNGLETLAVTTNGQLLKEFAKPLKDAGVGSVNVSLDTLNAERYKQITRLGVLENTVLGVKTALNCNFSAVKVNAVLLHGVNDTEIPDFIKFAYDNNIVVRFIELMPFSNNLQKRSEYVSADEIISKFLDGSEYLGAIGNSTAEYYRTKEGAKIGFIRPISAKFCARCNRVRITADGKLINCLHSPEYFDLKPYLNCGLKEYISDCVTHKPEAHHLAEGKLQEISMNKIGG